MIVFLIFEGGQQAAVLVIFVHVTVGMMTPHSVVPCGATFFGKAEYLELVEYMIARSRFPNIPHIATSSATGELKIKTMS
jgi:hypothetical protein